MAVGARDDLDIALVKKYASAKVDNPIAEASMVDPNKMLEAMNDYASVQKTMFQMRDALRKTCLKTTAMSIQYIKTNPLTSSMEAC